MRKSILNDDLCVFLNYLGNLSSNQTPVLSTPVSNETESPSRQESSENRTALLQSISNFNKSTLRKLA